MVQSEHRILWYAAAVLIFMSTTIKCYPFTDTNEIENYEVARLFDGLKSIKAEMSSIVQEGLTNLTRRMLSEFEAMEQG